MVRLGDRVAEIEPRVPLHSVGLDSAVRPTSRQLCDSGHFTQTLGARVLLCTESGISHDMERTWD